LIHEDNCIKDIVEVLRIFNPITSCVHAIYSIVILACRDIVRSVWIYTIVKAIFQQFKRNNRGHNEEKYVDYKNS
jgi:hypothetical protein